MSHAYYTEDQLVMQPAIRKFVDLGWETMSAEHLPQLAPSPSPK